MGSRSRALNLNFDFLFLDQVSASAISRKTTTNYFSTRELRIAARFDASQRGKR